MRRRFVFICGGIAAGAILAIDQWLKYLILQKISDQEIFWLKNSFFSVKIFPTLNEHLVWGIALPASAELFLLFTAVALLFYLARCLVRQPNFNGRTACYLGLLIGAAFGNLLDRYWRGGVIDFIHVRIYNFEWPAFNLADAALLIAAVCLVCFYGKRKTAIK